MRLPPQKFIVSLVVLCFWLPSTARSELILSGTLVPNPQGVLSPLQPNGLYYNVSAYNAVAIVPLMGDWSLIQILNACLAAEGSAYTVTGTFINIQGEDR